MRDLESNQTLIAKPFPELVTSRLVIIMIINKSWCNLQWDMILILESCMICNLSDDGARLLWLEFRGPGGEEELDMGKNPKVIDLRIFNDNFYNNVTL